MLYCCILGKVKEYNRVWNYQVIIFIFNTKSCYELLKKILV